MSQTSSNKSTAAADPQVGSAVVPIWIMIAVLIAFFAGGLYFDAKGGWFNDKVYAPYASMDDLLKHQLPDDDDVWRSLGQRKFKEACSACHGEDGMGKPNLAPTLVGSEWVVTDVPGRLIRIPLAGLTGPIKVKGELVVTSAGQMPAIGAGLNDEELAAVLSYIRNSWGNKAPVIKPEDVKAVRAAIVGHPQFTAEDLMKVQK